MTTAVRLAGVDKWFRAPAGASVTAAQGVDLEVVRGETVGIVGPNGAGKTTLLRLIAGIVQPDAGRIERLVRTVPLIDLGTGFHPDLTGDENIDFACALLGVRQRQVAARRASITDYAGIGDAIYKVVRHYSSGMVARLAFAIAVHSDPDLLLVDEVLAVGDMEFQRRCIDTLRDLAADGVTSLIVSHDLSAIASVCTRVVLLDQGRVLMDGAPADVISQYLGSPLDAASASLDVRVVLPEGPVEPGRIPIRAVGAARRRHPDATARVQLGLPVHPAANIVEGLDGPLIIAEAPIEGPWSEAGEFDLTYVVRAMGLPPGRFLARLVVDVPGGDEVHGATEFVVSGRPPLSPEVLLASTASVGAADLGD